MNQSATKHAVRHLNHKHSRFLQHLVVADKLKLPGDSESSNVPNVSPPPLEDITTNNCFSTNQVLVVIAVTCFLNFAFIILIMLCVQILGSTTSERENSEDDALLNDDNEDISAETGGLTNWESSKLRLASFPDNIITRNVAERLLKSAKLKSKLGYTTAYRPFSRIPASKTYHFTPEHGSDNEDSENEFTWTNCNPNYARHFQSRKEFVINENNT